MDTFWGFCLVLLFEQAPAEQCLEIRAARGKTLCPVKQRICCLSPADSDQGPLDYVNEYQYNLKDLELKQRFCYSFQNLLLQDKVKLPENAEI